MKALLTRLLVGSLLAFAHACDTHGRIADWADTGPVTLPIEVLGGNGSTVAVAVTLPLQQAAKVQALSLTVHGFRYSGQASVQLNDGAWSSLSSEAVKVHPQDAALGGIGGPSTIRLQVPLASNVTRGGRNEVAFRFDGSDGVSSGFRVVRLNFVDAAGADLLDASAFREADPDGAPAAPPPATSIEQGRRVWRERRLFAPTPKGARRLEARCGDCHTRDGRDLKYFGYSDHAITARAQFYGLSREEGEHLAAYIRALPVPTKGRPWSPPYQPGPGADQRPLDEWAAGMGLGAVASGDAEVVQGLLAKGTASQVVSLDSTLNLRELAVAIPLPDWNQWLPRVHPKDAWGAAFVEAGIEEGLELMRAKLAARGSAYALDPSADGFDDDLYTWGGKGWAFLAARIGAGASAGDDTETRRWMLVKVWELMQEVGLEGLGPQVYGERAEPRTWWSRWGFVWGARPEQLAQNGGEREQQALWYHRSAWMHLSAVTNAGNRRHREHSPMDWAGAFESARELSARGSAQNGRMMAYLIKATQAADNGIGPEDPGSGWNLYNTEPEPLVDDAYEVHWSAIDADARRSLTEAFLQTWVAKAQSYAPSRYKRGATSQGKTWDLEPPSYVPSPQRFGNVSDRLMYALPRLRALGVNPLVLDQLCDFAATLWPLGDWSRLKTAP